MMVKMKIDVGTEKFELMLTRDSEEHIWASVVIDDDREIFQGSLKRLINRSVDGRGTHRADERST